MSKKIYEYKPLNIDELREIDRWVMKKPLYKRIGNGIIIGIFSFLQLIFRSVRWIFGYKF